MGGRPVACVNSGTAALHTAFAAIGLGPGDEVLVQSLTFVATFQAISATGATPVACEVLPDTVTLDLVDAERKLSPDPVGRQLNSARRAGVSPGPVASYGPAISTRSTASPSTS